MSSQNQIRSDIADTFVVENMYSNTN